MVRLASVIFVIFAFVTLVGCTGESIDRRTADAEGTYGKYPTPVVKAFSTRASAGGALEVEIAGSGFQSGASVAIKKVSCQYVKVPSEYLLSCTLLTALNFTIKDILVTNPNGFTNIPAEETMSYPPEPPSLWLRADSLTLPNNAAVVNWADVSGSNNHGTTSGSLTFITNAFNGRPTVRSSTTSNSLLTPLLLPPSEGSIFILYKNYAVSPGCGVPACDNRVMGGANSDTGVDGIDIGVNTGSIAFRNSGLTGDLFLGPALNGNSLVLVSLFWGGNGTSAYTNGTLRGSSTTLSSISNGGIAFRLFSSGGGTHPGFLGDIPEILVFNSELSSVERMFVTSQLCSKYALSCP